jgi:hypothetical protein
MTSSNQWLQAAKVVGGVAILTVVAVVLFSLSAVGSGLAKVPPPSRPTAAGDVPASPPDAGVSAAPAPEAGQGATQPQPPPGFALALLAVCFLMSVAVAPVVVQSRWGGWRAAGALALLIWGQLTVLSQSRRGYSARSRGVPGRSSSSDDVLPHVRAGGGADPRPRLWTCGDGAAWPLQPKGWSRWAWRVAAVAVLHVAVYYTAGYYLAWKNPAVRAYYGGTDPGSFLLQLRSIAVGTPWMYPYQLAQGVLWALLIVLLVRMVRPVARLPWRGRLLRHRRPCQLLLPNAIMPHAVRLTQLVETIVSRVVFGFVAVWLLRPPARTLPREVPA